MVQCTVRSGGEPERFSKGMFLIHILPAEENIPPTAGPQVNTDTDVGRDGTMYTGATPADATPDAASGAAEGIECNVPIFIQERIFMCWLFWMLSYAPFMYVYVVDKPNGNFGGLA